MTSATFIERNRIIEEEPEESENGLVKGNKCYRFVTNRRNKMMAFVIIFTISVPILFFYFSIHKPALNTEVIRNTCAVLTDFRVMCGDGNFTETDCLNLDCCFDIDLENCYHYVPSNYYYEPSGNDDGTYVNVAETDIFGNASIESLKLTVQHIDQYRVKVILHQDESYESTEELPNAQYTVERYANSLGLDIFRDDGRLLFTSSFGPLIASENYLEWSFYLGSELFGLDQLYFTNNVTYQKVIYKNKNDSTTVPGFMGYSNGSYHGLFFDIAGPVEFSVLPSRLVSLRVLSSDAISFTLVTGPTPKDVQQQLYQFELPPRWLLEPHICRSGSADIYDALEEYTSFLESNTEVSYATDCLHDRLYYMLHSINDTEMESLTSNLELLRENSKFIMTVYPQVLIENNTSLYGLAEILNLLYLNYTGEIYSGTHLDREVAYLDYNGNAAGVSAWFEHMLDLFASLNVDGYSLKDNWPADEAFEMERVYSIPYLNKTFIDAMSHSLAWNATASARRQHYRLHNAYASQQLDLFRTRFQDALILTSSYSKGMDAIAQVHNVNTSWVSLKQTIKSTLIHGLLASPFISIPVCGSTSEYDPTFHDILCSRWYIVAATMPILSVHSELPRRDHASLPTGHNRNIALDALNKRTMFMPYYYTVLSRNEILTRPMFYDFYEDEYTHILDEQYMVGDALVVAQPMLKDMSLIVVYLPSVGGGFYEFFGGERYDGDLGNVSLSVVVESDWIVFMREGKIIPLQLESSSYTLAVALSLPDNKASGSLFFTSATLGISANNTTVSLSNLNEVREDLDCSEEATDLSTPTVISGARIYGLDENSFTEVTFEEVNLCTIETDAYEISYSVESDITDT